VASSVVGAIEPKLRQSETERAIRKPTEKLGAYDLYLRALSEFQKLTQSGWGAAVVLSTRALAIDPDYAPAAALIGWCRVQQAGIGGPLSASEIAESVRLATLVIEIGKDQPDALCIAAFTLSFFTGAHATAAGMIDHALTLNPNSALGWASRGWVAAIQDQADPAIEALQRAMRLSPLDPLRWFFFFAMSFAHVAARRFVEAIRWADRSLRERPRNASAYRVKAVACARLDRTEEARECARLMLELQPAFTISGWQRIYGAAMCTPETLAMVVEGMRKAGLPEE
jgi:tetratricopeptide (TPR) repeat protein